MVTAEKIDAVISLGSPVNSDSDLLRQSPPGAIVVPFAPQLPLLDRAALAITHAGLNTALEAMSRGVPMVAIPITNDQPGVASRLAWLGLAEVIPPARLTVPRLRTAIEAVLTRSSYRESARRRQVEITQKCHLQVKPSVWRRRSKIKAGKGNWRIIRIALAPTARIRLTSNLWALRIGFQKARH